MKLKKTNVVNVATLADVKTEVVAEESTRDEKFEELDIKNSDIESLISKAYDIHEHSTDYLVHEADNYNVRFNDFAGLTFLVDGDEIHELPISRFALGQLSAKVGVPLRYLEKCVSSGRIDLAKDNINSWLEDYKKDLFIREYNGCIRGVLSSKYSVCDSHEILDIVGNTIDLNNYKVKGSFLNDERLHVRLVSKEMLPIDNEDLFAGLFIDSSDVGRNTLTVQFGIYKQVCTNGLVVSRGSGVLFQQKHIGISAEDFAQGLRTSLENIPFLVDNAVEWVNSAKSKDTYGYDLKNIRSQEEMEEFIVRLRSATSLSEESTAKVINLMQTKYDTSRWGLVNGITEVAQDFTLEKRLDLERIAGNILVA